MTKGTKHDKGKLRFDLIPPEVTEALAQVLTFGAEKYDDDNWKKIEDFHNRYNGALMRHHNSRMQGEIMDPDSGYLHSAHMLANAVFLVWKDLKMFGKMEVEDE